MKRDKKTLEELKGKIAGYWKKTNSMAWDSGGNMPEFNLIVAVFNEFTNSFDEYDVGGYNYLPANIENAPWAEQLLFQAQRDLAAAEHDNDVLRREIGHLKDKIDYLNNVPKRGERREILKGKYAGFVGEVAWHGEGKFGECVLLKKGEEKVFTKPHNTKIV